MFFSVFVEQFWLFCLFVVFSNVIVGNFLDIGLLNRFFWCFFFVLVFFLIFFGLGNVIIGVLCFFCWVCFFFSVVWCFFCVFLVVFFCVLVVFVCLCLDIIFFLVLWFCCYWLCRLVRKLIKFNVSLLVLLIILIQEIFVKIVSLMRNKVNNSRVELRVFRVCNVALFILIFSILLVEFCFVELIWGSVLLIILKWI